jgi:hypothetical protein
MSIQFTTRSNEGQIHDHFNNIESALEYFISDSGYRLDFHFPDGKVLYIHRGEYGDEIPEEKVNHPAFRNYLQALSKVLLYVPDNLITDNVISVDFTKEKHSAYQS